MGLNKAESAGLSKTVVTNSTKMKVKKYCELFEKIKSSYQNN